MAKELPYFQFEPAEYLTGDITLLPLDAQGLFINIMCYYWQKDCSLALTTLKRRFNHPELIELLLSENIVKVKKGKVVIEFLDKQHNIISSRKNRLSKAGLKGAKIKKDKATLKPPLSQVEATLKQPDKIREDKIREEEIKEKDNRVIIPHVAN